MTDEITHLRSVAHTPDSMLQWEKDAWNAAVSALSAEDFDALMAPLLEYNRKGFMALPDWSRNLLAARWLHQK